MVIEKLFMTYDKASTPTGDVDVKFNLIEDEDGSTWWGYGHVDPDEFIAELNRWLDHTMGEAEPDFELDTRVDHLWARFTDEHLERFVIIDPTGPDGDAGFFPVTRAWL